jgi:Hemerythrin HHE cation binding domain
LIWIKAVPFLGVYAGVMNGHGQVALGPDLLAQFRKHLMQQERLCDRLEALADSLPDKINIQESLYVAQCLLPVVVTAHRFEEGTAFPLLKEKLNSSSLDETLDRLGFEHMGDEQFAEDICAALRSYVMDRHSQNAEAMAWMLRGFFDALRRHIAFEREHILPLLQKGVTE